MIFFLIIIILPYLFQYPDDMSCWKLYLLMSLLVNKLIEFFLLENTV